MTEPGDVKMRKRVMIAFAAIGAIISVHFLTRYFRRGNLTPFGIYCIVFGGLMLVYLAAT